MSFSLAYMVEMGLRQRETIERDEWSLYCHSTVSSPTLITAIFVLFVVSTMIILEGRLVPKYTDLGSSSKAVQVSMAVILWKNKKRLKPMEANDTLSSIFPASLFFRSVTFAIYIFLGIGISASILPSQTANSPIWKVTLTTPSIVMALTFGIQKDMIAFYWHPKRSGGVEEGG
ncbi:uncharacterized protein BT62DRAFT_1079455 [Guyanagaster necrorhizus]|uniref:Uncharacterized protein n=1 Tax=Guyanagaster necrorhizus TaxID=856835 RepID=A0A9P8APZ8_9AGAR|nr:uncharacterized protein BT62DRAFT_1079455 [Guyanagaster necrorhizus MCA 3950]KAG7442357.1 hypothetical protein BT62DRAFT_1079455 [Guyanagaster necrorhizus MCA 3950]